MINKGLHVKKKVKSLLGDIEVNTIKSKLDFLPLSVLTPNRAEAQRLKKICNDEAQTRELVPRHGGGFKKYEKKGEVCNATLAINSGFAASIFNPDLAQKIISMYAPEKANILDQFGGGGTRGIIAAMMGHKYTGIELRAGEVKRIEAQKKKLGLKFDIKVGNSITYDCGFEKFDFSLTCPPYYDLEVYSKDKDDLSNYASYGDFLTDLNRVMQRNYQALKAGSFSAWVVGNFRDKDGNLRHFNGDVVQMAQAVGFKLWDELIWQGAAGMAGLRSGQFLSNRKSVRVHEYILVFKK